MKTFQLEVITPDRTVYDGPVSSLVLPAYGGLMGVLPGHAPLLSPLETGPVKIVDGDGKTTVLFISGGFIEVDRQKTLILADVGESLEEINAARAEEARDRARARLKKREDADFDLQRAELALQRALMRLRLIEELRRSG